jgi:DeoR family transcriptional regulator, suf operon transcriptional repressor
LHQGCARIDNPDCFTYDCPMPLVTTSPTPDWDPPAGYDGVRGRILTQLKADTVLTTKELALRLGLSLNAVRHHLRELEEVALVESRRQRRGVGAPSFAYRLLPAGEALFTRRYESLLLGVLNTVEVEQGRLQAVALLERQFTAAAERIRQQLAGSSPEQRLQAVARFLSDEGYMAEAKPDTLIEHNCAVQTVAQRFPEICAAEARFLGAVLEAEVERERHMLNGCTSCQYRVRFAPGAAPLEESA